MNNTAKTGLYRLQTQNIDWGVAHLYEHLLIRSFHELVSKKGYSPYLYGWVGGETFQDVMFVEYGFYNPDIERLFIDFMDGHHRINLDSLDNEITRLEAEDNVIITVKDKKQLERVLNDMDKAIFIRVDANSDIEQLPELRKGNSLMLQERRSKKSFKQVTIAVGLPDASLEDKALFLRLTPIIFDAMNERLFNLGAYENEASWPVCNTPHSAMLAHAIYTVKRGAISNNELTAIAKEALRGISLRSHEHELGYYASGFVDTPNWHTFPVDYFRYTGILVSKDQIAKLLTVPNVENILQRLKVHTLPTTQEHFEYV